ncbi:MAG: hypothetical protein Q4A06_08765 [Cardiobacteriaceae bacterium]|nr:hypothetical protein [Cardiobacteriaceae bacterium]
MNLSVQRRASIVVCAWLTICTLFCIFSRARLALSMRAAFSGSVSADVGSFCCLCRCPSSDIWAKKMPDPKIRQTTTKGGYRGDNIDDVGAHYRDNAAMRQEKIKTFCDFLHIYFLYIKHTVAL